MSILHSLPLQQRVGAYLECRNGTSAAFEFLKTIDICCLLPDSVFLYFCLVSISSLLTDLWQHFSVLVIASSFSTSSLLIDLSKHFNFLVILSFRFVAC